MGNYREVYGDLIKMAQNGDFDAISHGANCFSVMGAGIAPQMAKAFGIDRLSMEHPATTGDINKLGQIQWKEVFIKEKPLYVINSYTQYHYNAKTKPFDYDAFTLCMRKINHQFNGLHVGLPGLIGCGLAGGNPDIVKDCGSILTEKGVIGVYTQPQLTIFDIVYNNKRYYKSYDEEISHNDAMSLVLEFLKEVV
jgi:O-acetyl-ADP-ribose deacetylase (regulator of RNase III)